MALLLTQAGAMAPLVTRMSSGDGVERAHATRLAALLAQHPASHLMFRKENVLDAVVSQHCDSA